ncbi:Probable protein phosphatase 2C 77 [Linum perenne]
MVHSEDFLWGFSVISLSLYLFNTITKSISTSYFFCLLTSSSSPCPLQLVHGSSSTGNQEEEQKNIIVINSTSSDHHMQKDFGKKVEKGMSMKKSRRPGKLIVPVQSYPSAKLEFEELYKRMESKEAEVHGKDFCLATKKGRREVMEDGYGVVLGHSNLYMQAFFTVIDGHGGREAMEYVAENLGKNIVKAMEGDEEDVVVVEEAIRKGYLVTDTQFLSQGIRSGACAASVVLKNGELHIGNVGDCRVVLSRNGVATPLTVDHRLNCRDDERLRIQNSGSIQGGYVHCGRVQGSLAVSRAIGDIHLKEWVISEPEISKIELSPDCQFLIMASDGLWDKVNEQEAVDEVSRHYNYYNHFNNGGSINNIGVMESCKKLLQLAFSRGNLDDATVMVVSLANFLQPLFYPS